MDIAIGDRQLGKTHYLVEKVAKDIRQGVDAVIICAHGERSAEATRRLLFAHGVPQAKAARAAVAYQVGLYRLFEGRRPVLYVDDLDALIHHHLFPMSYEIKEAVYNVNGRRDETVRIFPGTHVEEAIHKHDQHGRPRLVDPDQNVWDFLDGKDPLSGG